MSTLVPLTNVADDQPIEIARGTSLSLTASLVSGKQPVLPTDLIPGPTDLSPTGTYLLFLVKVYDTDPETGKPVPDASALLTLDSRTAQITVTAPATGGNIAFTVPPSGTTSLDSFGSPVMPTDQTLRWSLKLFLGDGAGGVASEHMPLSGPFTVRDRSVQIT